MKQVLTGREEIGRARHGVAGVHGSSTWSKGADQQRTLRPLRRSVMDLAHVVVRLERESSVGVGPFDGQTVFDPVLLAAGVDGHRCVAELLEPSGDGVAARARPGAVHDDRGLPVRQERRGEAVHMSWGEVEGAGKVSVGVVAGAEGFHEDRAVAVGDPTVQVLSADAGRQRGSPGVGLGPSQQAGGCCHRPFTPCAPDWETPVAVPSNLSGVRHPRAAGGSKCLRRGADPTRLTAHDPVALVLRRGHTVTSDFLVDLLWGDELPRNPANALQIQVSYLRKTLGAAQPDRSSVLETRAGGYALLVQPEQVDADRFEMAARSFTPLHTLRSQAQLGQALEDVERALGMWRGDALEDVAGMEFARGEITRLEELRWVTTERRVDLQLRLGRHGDTVGELSELVQRMPLRERFHEQLVLALYRSGRQADALRAYGNARRTPGRGARHRTRLRPA